MVTPAVRRVVVAIVGVVAAVVATGCQAVVDINVSVASGGTGSVVVSVGLDDDAVDRLGDPGTALATDDLVAAGWVVTAPERDDTGLTWVRASKAFEGPDGFASVVGEVSGPDGLLAGSALAVDDGLASVTTTLSAVVDASAGLVPYTDAGVTEATGGLPFGGLVEQVEADTGKAVADLIDVSVSVTLGDQTQQVSVRLGDAPVAVELVDNTWRWRWWMPVAMVGLVAVMVAVAARVRGRRRRRVAPAP